MTEVYGALLELQTMHYFRYIVVNLKYKFSHQRSFMCFTKTNTL